MKSSLIPFSFSNVVFKRLVFVILSLFFVTTSALATTYTYTWTGAGANTNWSNTSNWSCSPSGGTYPGSASTDIVKFSSSPANPSVTLDIAPTVASITYDGCGTVTYSCPVISSATQSVTLTNGTKTFTVGSTTGIVNNQIVAVTSGTATLAAYTSETISGTTVTLSNAPGGITGTCTVTFTTLNLITATNVNIQNGSQVIMVSGLTVSGTLTFSGGTSGSPNYLSMCNFTSGASSVVLIGNGTTGTLTGCDQYNYFTSSSNAQPEIKFNGASSTTFSPYFSGSFTNYSTILTQGNVTINGSLATARLSLASGTTLAMASTGTLTYNPNSGTSTYSGGLLDPSSGNLVITGSYDFTGRTFFNTSKTINNLTYNKSGGYLTLGYIATIATLNLTAGTVNNAANNITITTALNRSGGNLSVQPIYTGSPAINIAQSVTSGVELFPTTTNTSTVTVNDGFTYTINGTGITNFSSLSGGLGYTSASTYTLTIGTQWPASGNVVSGTQYYNGANLYTATNNGTVGTAPTATSGSGTVTSGTATWTYAGSTATGVAIPTNGAISGIVFTSAGSGYTSAPSITIPAPATPLWGGSTPYSYGNVVSNGTNLYTCIAPITGTGTSASSGGPSGTASSITDGAVTWQYIGTTSSTATATVSATIASSAITVGTINVGSSTSGTVSFPNSITALTLSITNNLTLAGSSSTFKCGTQSQGNVTHLMNVGGNITTNGGTFSMYQGAGTVLDVTLNGGSTQTLTGSTFVFNNLAISNANVTLASAASLSVVATLTIGANFTQPVNTTISTIGLTVNASTTFTISVTGTSPTTSSGTAGANNAVFNISAGAGTIANSGTVSINGWFNNGSTNTASIGGTWNIGSNGVYQLSANGGAIPTMATASYTFNGSTVSGWPQGSTIYFSGITTTTNIPTTGNAQPFYNVIWNCPQTANGTGALNPTAIYGTLAVLNTGASSKFFLVNGSSPATLPIGNVVVGSITNATSYPFNGGIGTPTTNAVTCALYSGSSTLAVSVTGNVTVQGWSGTNTLTSTATGCTLNIAGSFTVSGTGSSAFGGITTVNLNGSGTQILGSFTFNNLTISNKNVTLSSGASVTVGATLTVGSDFTQPVNTTITAVNLTVNGTTTYTISGTSASSLSAASTTNAVFVLSTSNGTVTNNGTITANGWITSNITSTSSVYSGSGTITFNNYSVFQQAVSGGSIPPATWNTGSTLYFSGTAGTPPTMPASVNNYANVIWNCTGQTSGNTSCYIFPSTNTSTLLSVNNLVVLNTGAAYLKLTNTNTSNVTVNVTNIQVGSGTGYPFNGSSLNTASGSVANFQLYYNTSATSPTISVSGSILVAGNTTNTAAATLTTGYSCTLAIQGSFTVNSDAVSAFTYAGTSGNIAVIFNGTTNQIVPALSYKDLTFSGAYTSTNNLTLASSGTINIYGTLTATATFGTGGYINSGSTINFNGTTSQTVPAFSYYNLTLSGAYTSSNNLTFASTGTIGIAGDLTASATFGTGGYVLNSSTVTFNGTGIQTIPTGLTFGTVNIYNGSVTMPAVLTVATFQIGDGTNATNLTQLAATVLNVTSVFTVATNSTYTIAVGTGVSTSSGSNNAVINFTAASGAITNNGTVNINGWFNNGSTYSTAFGGTWNIGVNGVYQHSANGGTIPSIATWTTGSTFYITGLTSMGGMPTNTSQSFYNVIYSCTGQTGNGTTGALNPTAINGSLVILNSGTAKTFYLSNTNTASTTIPIGNIIVGSTSATSYNFNGGIGTANGGVATLTLYYTNSQTPTISVGNVTIQGWASGAASLLTSNSCNLNITGNFTLGASNSTFTSTNTTVNFNGTAGTTQTISGTITFANLSISNTTASVVVGSGGLTIASGSTLTINSNAVLDLATYTLTTGATFTTSGSGTLKTQNTSTTPIIASKTWSFVVEYNNATGGQSVVAGTYTGGLTMTASSTGTNTATGTLTIGNVLTLNSKSTLDMGTYTGTTINTSYGIASGTSFTGSTGDGTLILRSNSSTTYIIPAGLTWGGTVRYGSFSNNRIVPGSYTHLDMDNGTACTINLGNSSSETGTISVSGTLSSVSTVTTIPNQTTFTFNGTGTQSIPKMTFYNLSITNTKGNVTASGAIGVSNQLNIANGATLDMSSNVLTNASALTTTGTGMLLAGATSTAPIPTGITWSFTVNYNGSGAQTVVAGSYASLTISGARTTNNVTLISGGTISVSGIFSPTANFTSGVYTVNSNTFQFNGNTPQSIPGAFTFYSLTINNTVAAVTATGGVTIASGGTLTVNSNAVLDMASYALAVGATFTTVGNGTLYTQSTSATPVTTGKTWSFKVIYNNLTGSQTVMSGTYNGGLTISNTSGTNTASGNLTLANVPLTLLNSGSTLDLGASNSISVSGTSNVGSTGDGTLKTGNLNNVSYKLTSGLSWGGTVFYYINGNTRIVPGSYTNLTIDNGTNGATGHTINWGNGTASEVFIISGVFSVDYATGFTANTSTVQFTGSSQSVVSLYGGSSLTNNISFYNLDISTATGFTFPSGTTSILNTFTPGTNISNYATQGTINFNNAAGGQTIPAFTYYNLSLSNTSGTQTASGAIVVKSNLTLPTSSGVFDVSASNNYPVSIGGNWVSSVSTSFNAENGTVTFNSTSGTQSITGSNTFYNLTDNAAGTSLTVVAGTTQTITNKLTLTGASGNLLNFRSSTSAVAYITLTNYALTAINYCNITYITNNSAAVNATISTNGGNNTNIKFNNVWIGGSGGSWNTATNWGSGTVPTTGDDVVFDNSVSANANPTVSFTANPVAGSLTFNNSNVTFTYNLALTAPLTVSGNVTLTGSTVVMGTSTTSGTTGTGIGLTVNGSLTLQSSTSPAANSKLQLCHYQVSTLPTVTNNIFNGSVITDVNNVLSVYSKSIAPQIQFTYSPTTVNSGTGNFYFDQNVTGGFGLYKLLSSGAKQTIKLGNNLDCGRLSLSSSSLASSTNPAIDLNGNTLTASSGTSSYSSGSIKADATGSSLVITTPVAFPLGANEFSPSSIYSLTLNENTTPLTLAQALTVNNLYLTSGSINNTTFNITMASGGTIYAAGGTLNVAPVFAGTTAVTSNATCTAGYELKGTGGSVGALTINAGTYTLASSASVASLNIANGATLSYPNSGTAITLTATGDVTTNTSGTLTGGTQTGPVLHQLVLGGNLTGSGSLNLTGSGTANAVDVTLNGTGEQTISSGITFNTINIYNGGVVLPALLSASNIIIGDGTHTISLTQPVATLVNVTNAFTLSANATFTISAGTGSSVSAGTNNAVLNFNSANGTITNNGIIAINGWFTNGNQNSSTATTLTGSGTWTIGGQGVYNHNTINGTIPTMTSWVAGSTLYYTGTRGAGTIASGTNQSFRKVVYNCPLNSSSANYFNPTAILDTLYIVNSGSATPRTFQIENSITGNINIGTLVIGTGTTPYYFNGGISTINPVVLSLGTTTAPTITVVSDVLVQGNGGTNTASLTSSSGNSTLNVGGNINVGSNASFTTSNIAVNLNGSGTSSTPQNITSAGQTFTSLTVSNSTYVTLANDISITGSLTLTAGTLNDGGNTVTVNGSIPGTGTHTGSGLLLITGGASTHYVGASTGTINLGNVQINCVSNIVALAGNATINGTLTLTAGLFNVYSYNLVLAYAPVGYTSSSYIYHFSTGTGSVTINNVGSGTTVFPVGISGNYVPITFVGTTNSPNITVGFGLSITNLPINSNSVVGMQWSVQSSTASSSNITFQYNSNNQNSSFLGANTVVAGIYAGGAYTETILGSVSGSSPYTVSTTSAFTLPTGGASLYVIGNQYAFSAGAPSPYVTSLNGGNGQATIGFSAVTNGSAINSGGYTITPYIGATAQTTITGISTSPYTITGLINGTTYRFVVSATNGAGTGASAYSNYITIATPTVYDTLLANMTAMQNLYASLNTYNSNTYGFITTGITDSVFNNLDYIDNTSNTVNLDVVYYNHIQNVLKMATAYTNNYTYINGGINKSCYNNPLVYTAIKKTLYWWVDHVQTYTVNNWHYATIDYTNALGQILVLMRGIGTNVDTTGWSIIEQHAISNLFAKRSTAIGTYAGTHKLDGNTLPSAMTGANAINISSYWLNWGALVKSPTVIDTALQSVVNTLDYTQSTPEGLKQDYSFMQHYAQLYTEQYGAVWASAVVTIANYLKTSSLAMSQSQLDTVYNFIHNTYYAGARGMYKDFNGSGREIGVYRNNGIDSTLATYAILVDQNPTHVANYKKDAANSAAYAPVYTDTIHTHYYTSDYTIHKRPNFNFSVRGVSTRTTRSESINDQNLLGTFATEGATCILIQGNEYEGIFPNWNWNYIPGITMSDSLDGSGNSVTQYNPNSGAYDTGYTKFVGGVSDGKYGASTFSLNYNGVIGNKSWFFFDTAVVCLGANITSSKSLNINTSVNQANINGPIYYNNAVGGAFTTFTPPTNATPTTVTGTNIYSVFHDSIGYFFPAGGNVSIKQDSVYGNWSATDTLSAARPDTSDVFLLSLGHGAAPSAASYQYIVAPGISYTTMQNYNPLSTISILSNTKYVQAVKHNGLNRMQVIFDSASSITDPTSGITVKVNKPCALMLTNMGQQNLTVTLADPAQIQTSIMVTLSYRNPTQFNIVTQTMPSGYGLGSSVSFTVDTSTASATWLGTYSTNYNATNNWQSTVVPDGSANVTIAAGANYYPVLNTSSAISLNNLLLTGGSFTVNSTDTLKVKGAITNTSGTVTVNGTVSYTGTTAQSIAANTFASNTVSNLRINNTAGVTLSGALAVSGTVYPTAGTLNSNGNLTLLSTNSGTARIDQVLGSISGDVTVQRYITAKTARKYSFIGSPVTATVRSSWQKQMYVTGYGTGGTTCGTTFGDGVLGTDKYNDKGFDVSINNSPTIYNYNATLVNGSRYVGILNTQSTNLTPGTGYIVNIRGDRNSSTYDCANQLNSTNYGAPEAVTLSATGTVTTGDLTGIALNDPAVHPYTLLANPYPSTISFSAFKADNSNINNKMWTYSPFGDGNYTTYSNGAIANGAPNLDGGTTAYDGTNGNYIASGQAFFVQANTPGTPGTVTFKESHKTTNTLPNTLYFGATTNQLIRIGLKTTTNNSLLDEIVVRFNNNGSTAYVPDWDANSLSNATHTLASLKGSKRLAIATHPLVTSIDTTQLGIKSSVVGTYQLAFSDYQDLDNSQSITLIDKFLGTTQDVRANQSYVFKVTSDTASIGNNRFVVLVGAANTLPVNFTAITATKTGDAVAVKWSIANEAKIASYEVERSTDDRVFNTISTKKAAGTSSYEVADASLPADATTLYYRIKAMGTDGTKKYSSIAKVSINNYQLSIAIYPNPVQHRLNITLGTASGSYQLRITTVTGNEVYNKSATATNGKLTLDASNLTSGVYMLELTDNQGNKYKEKFVKE